MTNTHKKLVSAIGAVALTGFALLSTGCASIVHSGSRNISIGSTPQGATVTIVKADTGASVHSGTTPLTVALDQRRGYFKGQDFKIKFELAGYKSTEVLVRSELSGWYFGNIVLGGPIGMIVVDPLTGAMWNLTPDKIETKLTADQSALIKNGDGFLVVLVSDITPAEKTDLIRVN